MSQGTSKKEQAHTTHTTISSPFLANPSRTNAHTSPWVTPTGDSEVLRKELRPSYGHKIEIVWGDKLGRKVIDCLDELNVKWTSLDIVRIATDDEPSPPVVLWIGVNPDTLSFSDGNTAAFKCLDLLRELDITDVDVEIRESVVWH
ncbi:hypothetical protein BXZ70DRAFT_1007335 [Cristinia sonorae]|uniref:Uncharacterized protein n=1 Tax=Cristinia sonorae TaxID=1940300 RepID=A0A8K0URB8_9AGAR|nr:hypothetical protein BXZ70DRAFT_1007335 [Cristinia sonorae]